MWHKAGVHPGRNGPQSLVTYIMGDLGIPATVTGRLYSAGQSGDRQTLHAESGGGSLFGDGGMMRESYPYFIWIAITSFLQAYSVLQ